METFFSLFENLFKKYGSILDPLFLIATIVALLLFMKSRNKGE